MHGACTPSGLLNGGNDVVEVDEDLLIAYSINMTYVDGDGGQSRDVSLAGEASPQAYEMVSIFTFTDT